MSACLSVCVQKDYLGWQVFHMDFTLENRKIINEVSLYVSIEKQEAHGLYAELL